MNMANSKKLILKTVSLLINGKPCKTKAGQNILNAAKQNNIDIPSLCFHPDLSARASCRLCLVEIKGRKDLVAACSTQVAEGMVVKTESPRLTQTRRTNLELIFGAHRQECPGCILENDCRLINLGKKYCVRVNRFANRKAKRSIVQCGPLIFDQTKCLDCHNCVEVCPTGFLEIKNRGADINIAPSQDKNKDCVHCGQCVIHCPVGAISSAGENNDVNQVLRQKRKNKILVAQFAPAVRSSLGEAFGLPPGQITSGQLTAGLKKLGFACVFDTCVGADFTSFEEARELIERVDKNKNLPAFTSCCPAWVKFVELRYPQFLKNLCTTRSPQIILGGLIKTYWAREQNLDPKNIAVVSIMPCTSKKYEIKRPELKIKRFTKLLNGHLAFWSKAREPVDVVLTARELAYLFKKHHIDLKTIKPVKPDNPFGNPTGAGVIYGASGGVFESALRTAIFQTTGKKNNFNLQALRGEQGIKRAKVKLGEITIKAVVVSGLRHAQTMLEELKKNPKAFDAMEVMACPGGCIGGGGQPMPADETTRQKRAQALYNLDAKKEIRLAHENPVVKKVYKEFLTNETLIHQLCHTKYSRKKKTKLLKLKH